MPATKTKRSFSGPPFISTKRLYNLVTDLQEKEWGKGQAPVYLASIFDC